MNNTRNHFKSFAELQESARDFIEFPIGGPRRSWPVPVRRQNRVLVAFMFCFGPTMPGPVYMSPPSIVGWLDPVTGKRIARTQVSPADFGQADDAHKSFPPWSFSLPAGVTIDALTNLEKRLLELYDTLFAVWAVGVSTSDQAKLQTQAREFLKLFDQISEPPLRPYYEALGRDWFVWLRAVAQ